jgi:hypothetical protein
MNHAHDQKQRNYVNDHLSTRMGAMICSLWTVHTHIHPLTFGNHLLEILVQFPPRSVSEPLRESPQRVVLVRDLVTRSFQLLSKHERIL